MGRCPNCRRQVNAGDGACDFCGEQLDQQRGTPDTKSDQQRNTRRAQSDQQRSSRETQSSQQRNVQQNSQKRGDQRCPKCRRPVGAGDSVCEFCGEKIDQHQSRQQRSGGKGAAGRQTTGGRGNTKQGQNARNRNQADTRSGSQTGQNQANTTGTVPGGRSGQRGQSTGPVSQSGTGHPGQSQAGGNTQPTQHRGQQSSAGGRSSRNQQGNTGQARRSEASLAKYIIPGVGVGALAFLVGAAVRGILSVIAVATQDEAVLGLGYEDTGMQYWLVDQVVAHPMVMMESSEAQLDGTTIIQEVPALGAVFVALVGLAVIVFSYLFAKRVPKTGSRFAEIKLALIFAVGYTATMTAVAVAIETEASGNLFDSELQTITLAADPLTAVVSGFVVSCVFSYVGTKISD